MNLYEKDLKRNRELMAAVKEHLYEEPNLFDRIVASAQWIRSMQTTKTEWEQDDV